MLGQFGTQIEAPKHGGRSPSVGLGQRLGRGSFGRPAGFERPTRRERTVDLHVLKDCEILNLVDAVPEHSGRRLRVALENQIGL